MTRIVLHIDKLVLCGIDRTDAAKLSRSVQALRLCQASKTRVVKEAAKGR